MPQPKNQWKPNPGSQERALASDVYELFYGGAAGGGKSDFLLIDALYQVSNPSYRAILFRKTYQELEESLILRSHELYPALGAKYHEQKKRWTFPSGATIKFGYLARDSDVYQYQSAQYAYLGFDEATHFNEFQIRYLKSRNRCADKTVKKYIRYASNPGNVGHLFFKERFIEDKIPYKLYKDAETGLMMQFIPSKVHDNVVLMEEDPEYVMRLEALPEDQRRALLDGDWDVFAGQFFKEWRKEKHIVPRFDVPEEWNKYRSIDFGRTAPFCCKWYAVDYDGHVWVYREYYQADTDAEVNFKKVKELSGEENYRWTVMDSSTFSAMAGAKFDRGRGETIADIAWQNGIEALPSPKGRLDGWNLIHQYLRWKDIKKDGTEVIREPKMKYMDCCRDSIRTIPALIHDESANGKNKEDIDPNCEDHAIDADSYFLQQLWGEMPKKKEKEKTNQWGLIKEQRKRRSRIINLNNSPLLR